MSKWQISKTIIQNDTFQSTPKEISFYGKSVPELPIKGMNKKATIKSNSTIITKVEYLNQKRERFYALNVHSSAPVRIGKF